MSSGNSGKGYDVTSSGTNSQVFASPLPESPQQPIETDLPGQPLLQPRLFFKWFPASQR